MESIKLTKAQARIYDSGDEMSWRNDIFPALLARATARANKTGSTVEIYHPDGFVIEAVEPNWNGRHDRLGFLG